MAAEQGGSCLGRSVMDRKTALQLGATEPLYIRALLPESLLQNRFTSGLCSQTLQNSFISGLYCQTLQNRFTSGL
ncbi:unnamed protein product [Gadus morhua 'NCC']